MEINKEYLYNHIFFQDDFSTAPSRDQQQKNYFRDLISEIILRSLFCFKDDYYVMDPKHVESDLININYYIDLFPQVNAGVDVNQNSIYLNLYTIIAANDMTLITDLLDYLNSSEEYTTSEIMEKASEWMKYNKKFVSSYIGKFGAKRNIRSVFERGKIYATWPSESFTRFKYSEYSLNVLWLIYLHEFGHWQYARFKREWKVAYNKLTLNALYKECEKNFIEENQCRLDSWVKEIIADYIAVLVFTLNNRIDIHDKQCAKECYMSIGLFYGLVSLEELGQEMYNKIYNTHPPAWVRQKVVQRMYANFFSEDLKISYNQFIEREIKEWYIIQDYFHELIEKYIAEGK